MSNHQKSRHVFLDESGDPSLNIQNQGVTNYFVISAVIVPSSNVSNINSEIVKIKNDLFSGGEIKSSNIGNNIDRRIEVLTRISSLEIKHYSQVIDKTRIISDSGLRFRRSFVKFVNRILYEQLFSAYSDLIVFADKHGRSDFMRSFPDYLQRRLPQQLLFETQSFAFVDSKDYPLIQIADIISGTIRRCYSGIDSIDILNLIKDQTIIIDEWPPRFPEPLGFDDLEGLDKYSYIVRKHALTQAEEFIEENSLNNDYFVKAQVAAVRYLLFQFRVVDPEQYISSIALLKHLNGMGFDMSEWAFRSRVIAKIRDHGVFIASTNKGLKIPYSIYDLLDFVTSVNSKTIPYLHRLEICRDYFLMATQGELDIVDEKQFPQLFKYLS